MALKIIRGQVKAPMRALIYGPAGVGKTTLAAGFPKPIFFDTEESTNRLEVDRVVIPDWKTMESSIRDLAADPSGYKTLIIDTIDWAERYLIEGMLQRHKKESIEDIGGGFGKGFTLVGEAFGRFLASLDTITAKGLHIVFVGHSKVVKVSPPDETEGYDRYEPKLSKHVTPLVKEWAECIFFANFQIQVVKGNDGKIKAQGGKDRMIYTQPSAAMDAKNRYGLDEFIPMDISSLEHLFIDIPASEVNQKPAPAPVIEEKQEQEPEGEPICASQEQVSKLALYAQNDTGGPMIKAYLAEANVIDTGELSPEQADELIKSVQKAQNAASEKPKTQSKPNTNSATSKLPANIVAWLTANADALEAAFVKWNWIKVGQSWRDLPHEKVDKIMSDPSKAAKAAGVASPGGAS